MTLMKPGLVTLGDLVPDANARGLQGRGGRRAAISIISSCVAFGEEGEAGGEGDFIPYAAAEGVFWKTVGR